MDSVLFQNVKVVDSDSKHNGAQVDILVEKGKITQVAAANSISSKSKTVHGGMLSPGWVDMRTHLTDPGNEQREDLKSLSAAALKGGFSRVLGMPNTQPVMDNSGQIEAILHRAATLPIHLHIAGALSENAKGNDLAELYDMHQKGAVAFTDGKLGTSSAGLLLRGLQYMQPFGGLLISSPIDQTLAGDGIVGESLNSLNMGLKGIPKLAEAMQIERDLRLLRYFAGKLHIGPVTTKSGLDLLLAAKAEGLNISIETSALYLLLDDAENLEFDPVSKVYPPLRCAEDVAALRQALAAGKIDVVSSSHHPQGKEEKMHDYVDAAFGAATLETSFAAIVSGMQLIPHEIGPVIAALANKPRAILNLPKASIEVGESAELTHFDPNASWKPTISDMRSKSKSNPLLGRDLQGKVLGVYVKGKYWEA